MVTAYIGLGGNVGDPADTLRAAFRSIDGLPGTRVTATSGLYRTPAWGREEQPDFINAVACVATHLPAQELLAGLLDVERAFGRHRDRAQGRWGPRVLDLDLLLYGDDVIDEPGLRVPHPHLHERAFVLVPLVEVAPGLTIPGIGRADAALASMASDGIQALP
ncbi:2-amino-4-hydroxy-6-hydroxymethyldihydropteridine diphosphokinase [Luteimonas vadosa]|uniref:2-amino-4-hydroxy-6- hydroxymethyldihydropteridine diphosphokinase n=1 Tax=Luteimonas vadosa TaxID=1165507 RepID=UPI0031EA02CB